MSYARIEHAGGAIITTLGTGIGSGDTSLTLAAGTNWPTGSTGPFYLVIDPGLSGEEKILATARSGTSVTGLTRGVDGTSAAAHATGATIQHVFSASEADEANQLVKATLGTVTTKGDLLPATGAGALARLAAGSDGLPLVAASGQTAGLQYAALAAAGLASDSVTTAKILNANVTTAKINDLAVTTGKIADEAVNAAKILDDSITGVKIQANAVDKDNLHANVADTTSIVGAAGLPLSVKWKYGTFSGTTSSTGFLTVTHGAGFTPAAVLATPSTPNNVGGGNIFASVLVDTLGATTFRIRALGNDGSALNAVAVTGYFLCLP